MNTLIAAAILAAVPGSVGIAPAPGTTVQTEDPCKKSVPAGKCHILQKIKDYSSTAREDKEDRTRQLRHMLNEVIEDADRSKPEKPRFRSKCEGEKPHAFIGSIRSGVDKFTKNAAKQHIENAVHDMPQSKCGGSYNRDGLHQKIKDILKKV